MVESFDWFGAFLKFKFSIVNVNVPSFIYRAVSQRFLLMDQNK